jgi:hypothetical protein
MKEKRERKTERKKQKRGKETKIERYKGRK